MSDDAKDVGDEIFGKFTAKLFDLFSEIIVLGIFGKVDEKLGHIFVVEAEVILQLSADFGHKREVLQLVEFIHGFRWWVREGSAERF